jgi:3-hydroxyacyl-[acyl-carrier-protein] dehydratase
MVEAIAQLGAIALLADDEYRGRLPLFGGIDKARFRRQAVPGDVLDLEVELDHMTRRAGKGHGTARINGDLACSASLLFVIVDA